MPAKNKTVLKNRPISRLSGGFVIYRILKVSFSGGFFTAVSFLSLRSAEDIPREFRVLFL